MGQQGRYEECEVILKKIAVTNGKYLEVEVLDSFKVFHFKDITESDIVTDQTSLTETR